MPEMVAGSDIILGNEEDCEKVFNINPKDFAEMFEMLLKGVETQFFITKDMASTRATYNEMVDFIIK